MGRLLLGLVLLPTSGAALWAAACAFQPVLAQASRSAYFLAGFFAYPALHLWAGGPTRVYVFGHEMTHALAAILSGARVTSFTVGEEGGKVEVTAVNPFISLAPYCVPLYTLTWMAVFRLAGLWTNLGAWQGVFLTGMGATLSFHLWYTISTLVGQKQPDLVKAGGVVFSLALIAVANSLAVALTLRALFPHMVSLRAFFDGAWSGTRVFWTAAVQAVAMLVDKLRAPEVPAR